MKKNVIYVLLLPLLFAMGSCGNNQNKTEDKTKQKTYIENPTMDKTIQTLITKYAEKNKFRIEKGVKQVASFWNEKDGKDSIFEKFCVDNFAANEVELKKLFDRLSINYEVLFGNFNKISLDLKRPLDLDIVEPLPVDDIFGAYDASAHLNDDFFLNKMAFIVLLNFPAYTLKEKTELGNKWSRLDWAYARMGDMYSSRVPADLIQKSSDAITSAGTYIANYNIMMGNLLNNNGKTIFPKDLKLITHWGLRDELKADYNAENGLEKQKMIYEVMLKIISQDIPQMVINNPDYQWNPIQNKVYKQNSEVKFEKEANVRYQHIIDNFIANKEMDAYNPQYPNFISRKFELEMEIPQKDVEKLFTDFVSSPVVKDVAALISKRLNRKLQPFDIWYDGFKSRSSISQEELDKTTKAKYPNVAAVQKDLSNILIKLGFTSEKANYITSKISVDPSRGAGHAWGTSMKTDQSHLRTRVGKEGMDYKGYNIAVHEFGHTVEQTLSINDVDYYFLRGVPNTAFTEALAFVFQKRDIELLGIKKDDSQKKYMDALDNFWSCYEIMGVSLLDMQVWQWLYDHPKTNAAELKEAVITISKDIWNKYYADVFGVKDQPILAIYSHMISDPLYLSNYPIGHLIEFQVDQYLENKKFADEVTRIYTYGRIIPQLWMKNAVGSEISIQPTLKATEEALKNVR